MVKEFGKKVTVESKTSWHMQWLKSGLYNDAAHKNLVSWLPGGIQGCTMYTGCA